MSNLISAIVPVHDAQFTLRRCISSLLNQRDVEVEVIAVENGSSDKSLNVLERLYGNDGRVRIFSLPEAGAAPARAYGISQSRGDWLVFCDSDDWYERDALSTLLQTAVESRVEIVDAGYRKVISPIFPIGLSYSGGPESTISCEEYDDTYFAMWYNPVKYGLFSGLCSSIYHRPCFEKLPSQILSNKLNRGEDLLVNAWLHQQARAVKHIPTLLYRYRIGGVTSTIGTLLNDQLTFKRLMDSVYVPQVHLNQKRADIEFAEYLVVVMTRRYQSAWTLSEQEIDDFYSCLVQDDRFMDQVRLCAAHPGESREVDECVPVLLNGNHAELMSFVREKYGRKRVALGLSGRLARLLERLA